MADDRLTEDIRRKCFRIGNHYVTSHYTNRPHLLPVKDLALFRKLIEIESERPQREDVEEYAKWKAQEENIRQMLRTQTSEVIKKAKLVAMTTTRAVFDVNLLMQFAPYDLIVFDESSQVAIPHALSLAHLGKKVIFAGDPKQLAPIVRSSQIQTKKWFGQSMFILHVTEADYSCMLNEQSRMAEPICSIVSNIFYNGELKVARECKFDPRWSEERKPIKISKVGEKNVHIIGGNISGTWSKRYHGPIRHASAKFIADWVIYLRENWNFQDILILTPFRAQRALIRRLLSFEDRKDYRINVSTVHRSQGSECHTVIFDPAMGNSPFLQTEDAERLLNVALSRAKSQLFLIFSDDDLKNPLFQKIAKIIEKNSKHE